jgi:hypothetical protein
MVVQHPPEYIQQAQKTVTGFGSIKPTADKTVAESTDDLFAKALSPRSPDLPRSPFSFSTQDTKSYVATRQA